MRSPVWMACCVVAALVASSSIAEGQGRGQGQGQGQGRRSLEGTLEVYYEDSAAGTRLIHILDTGTERIPLRMSGQERRRLTHGSRVRVRGTMTDGTLALDPDSGGESSFETLALASPYTFGPQATLVILFNFLNLNTQPYTTGSANTVTFTQANNFYQENSYGQTSLQGTVAGWYTINANVGASCLHNTWTTLANQAAGSAGVPLQNYTRIIYAFPQVAACAWWGLGTVGGGGSAQSPSKAWINGTFSQQVVAHELGHNFGSLHAWSRSCDAGGCVVTEYGDTHDIMGAAVNGHLNAFSKERLGWLGYGSSPSIQTVTTSGNYNLESYAAANGGLPKALKMLWSSVAGVNTYIYAEARTQVGADSSLAPGVIIHTGVETDGASYELDVKPATPTIDYILSPGETIVFENAFSISTVASGAFGASLAVTDLSVGSPTALVSPAASGPYGGTTTLSATLTAGGSPVVGGRVDFTLNGVFVGFATTSSSGTATVSNVSLAGFSAATYPTATGASFAGDGTYEPSTGTTSLTVNPKQVTPSVVAADKVYDQSNWASLTSCTVNGVVGTDAVGCIAMAPPTFATSNVGSGITVTATSLTLVGPAVGNYVFSTTTATATASITPRSVTPVATVAAKSYDGTTAAILTSCTLTGALSGDVVGCTGAATFDTPAVGSSKTVTVSGLTLTGSALGNYALSTTTATTTGIIAALVVSPAVTAATKPYDGTTSATLATCTLSGVLAADAAAVGCTGTASFATASVGTGKTVTVSGLTLTGGAPATNYVLSTPTATTTAAITALTVTPAVTAADKPYDGTPGATLATCTLSGVLAADAGAVGCTGTASFATASVGTGKTVTVSGLTLTGGAAAGNYTLSSPTAATTASITALTVTPAVTASNKSYDGTTSATLASCTLSGVIGEDAAACTGTASFGTPDVGTGKTVTVSGLALTGTAASNYTLSTTTALTTASITALPVTPAVTAADKPYDGTPGATLATCTLSGVLAADAGAVGCTGTASFDTASVGIGKTVTVSSLTLTGAVAGNYTLATTTAITTAAITQSNRAPVVTNPGSQSAFQGAALTLSLSATDADDDPLTWSALNLPPGISINASTGELSGTPTTTGAFGVVVSASDESTSGQASFVWSIESPLPGLALPLNPSGPIATSTPTIAWSAVPLASYYLLSISDASAGAPTEAWYTPAQAHCASGAGTCTVEAPRALLPGLVSWRVLTWNPYGYGQWSPSTSTIVDLADVSTPPPTQSGPSGAIATRTPSYAWAPVATANWYQLSVTDAIGTVREFWYKALEACPAASCGVTPNLLLPIGPSQWQVRAWTPVGSGAWSASRAFETADSAPGKASVVSPTAAVTSPTPAFAWNAVIGTSYYLLRVIDRDNATSDRWYRPSDAGCPMGSGTCSVSPGTNIKAGPAIWRVLTWNGSGYGPWSDPAVFSVEIVDPSALTPTPLSPTESISTPNATYRWTAVAGVTFYRLSVRNNGNPAAYWWFTPADAGCAAAAECSAIPQVGLQNGTVEWQIQAWTAIGHGNWSTPVSLTVTIPAPPAPVPVSPSGSASASPSFTWNASAGATLYYIRADDSTGLRVDRWLTPSQVGCPSGTGVCTFNAGVTLNSGAGAWRLLAWNPAGYSPWSSTMAFVVP